MTQGSYVKYAICLNAFIELNAYVITGENVFCSQCTKTCQLYR